MRCLNCGTENNENNLVCSNCGRKLIPKDSMKKVVYSIVAAVIVCLVIINVISTVIIPNNAANKMRKAFDSKTGAEVISVFTDYCGEYSVVYDDLSKSGRLVYLKFVQCISEAKGDLNDQSVDTDINNYLLESMGDIVLPQAYSAITTIGQYNDELDSIVTDYYELYTSKISYTKGVELFNANDFSGAISSLSNVIEEDSWYDDAQSKLTESQEKLTDEKIALIEKYINNGDYDNAQQEINSLRYENLTEEMAAKLDNYETQIYEAKLAKIDEYVESGDLDAANEYIESLGDGLSSDAQARLDQAIKNKAEDYLAKADEALKSGERQGAYDMALMAQNLCPDDDEINKKVTYFKEFLPFALYYKDNAISYSDSDMWGYTGGVDWNEKITSNNNKTMEQCIYFYYQSEYKGQFKITYNFGKKYDSISGTLFLPNKYKNHSQNGYFEIYGDGKLLYTSKKITKNVMPNKFNIKVTGVDVLTVKFFGTRTEDWNLGDAWSGYAISNLVATKNLPK